MREIKGEERKKCRDSLFCVKKYPGRETKMRITEEKSEKRSPKIKEREREREREREKE